MVLSPVNWGAMVSAIAKVQSIIASASSVQIILFIVETFFLLSTFSIDDVIGFYFPSLSRIKRADASGDLFHFLDREFKHLVHFHCLPFISAEQLKTVQWLSFVLLTWDSIAMCSSQNDHTAQSEVRPTLLKRRTRDPKAPHP